MKKFCLLSMCFCLFACDNNTITGKCLQNEKTVTTTELDGEIIKTKTNYKLLCGCFENQESEDAKYIIPKEEFLFQSENSIDTKCDKQCIKLCKNK